MRSILIAIAIAACSSIAATDDYTALEQKMIDSLAGSWTHHDVRCLFDNEDGLTVIRDNAHSERKFTYRLISAGDRTFLRCVPADGGEAVLMLKGDVTDSTAVLALGTVFVRADSGDGLTGTWEQANGLSITRLIFSDSTVTFTASRLDMDTGSLVVMESKRGDFTLATGKRGQIRVAFDSGEAVDMVPLVADGVMYLFDLSPRKSMFVKKPQTAGELLVDNQRASTGADNP